MNKLLIGTCGYDYPKDWTGIFYPPSLRRDELLSYYADHFNALELDFSYYTMPKAANLQTMLQKTDNKIMFAIKGHQDFTHNIDICLWRNAVKQFRDGIYPLAKENKLSAVLLQFPQSFHYTTDTRIYLDNIIKEFSGFPIVVEFRHTSWQQDRVYEGLQKRNTALCLVDLPNLPNLPTFKPVITSDISYIRFHGRNKTNWHNTNATSRYDYNYTTEELALYKEILKSISQKSKFTQIYFNNHAKGNAPANAQKLMTLLSDL
jgi:uncharacterized protein YecE (DUF72 family)